MSHIVHVIDFSVAEKVPTAQVVHDEAAEIYVPATQDEVVVKHDVAPVVNCVSMSKQLRHMLEPEVEEKVPAGQIVHDDEPVLL